MSLVLVTGDRFVDHVTPPGHPERAERAEAMQVVAARWSARGGRLLEPRAATDEELTRVHHAAYVESVVATRGRTAMLDPDTFASPDTEAVARLAAGAVVAAVEHVMAQAPGPGPQAPGGGAQAPGPGPQAPGGGAQAPGLGRQAPGAGPQAPGAGAQAPGFRLRAAGDQTPVNSRALVLVRPPGHHAEADRAMGFCFYNSIAVAAAAARARGLSRVAVVDFDVHHGNGTQWMFYDDPSVLFVSSHQYPFYPGTGAARDTGRGEGVGYTVNLPMEVGATDADFDLVYREVVIPVLEQFRPEVVLVSAGFDAHELDPLAGMRMTTAGYGQITARLLAAADKLCDGRIVFVTEGGYDTSALAGCCQAVIDLASGESVPSPRDMSGETRRGQDTTREFRRAHSR